jgi:hypothetical protein
MKAGLGLIGALLLLSACAGTEWPRNLYEGVRAQASSAPDPRNEPATAPLPDYEQYRRARQDLKSAPESTR